MVTSLKTAVVAMSGGVDSSVAALLLKNQGYNVVGLTGKMLPDQDSVSNNAYGVAEKLGIKLITLDVADIFRKCVIEYFENSYLQAKTPNPCIVCNKFIKWGALFDYAVNCLNADVFATGHYADIRFDNGFYKIFPAKDSLKDQLYFLYRLSQKQLSKTVFPLANFSKSEIKNIAVEYDLPPKDSKESQDICFIQKPLTTKKYLNKHFGVKPGKFVEITSGNVLGNHNGAYFYTIGQRKGIGISAPYPLYVVGIDGQNNIVYLGKDTDNFSSFVSLNDINFLYPVSNKHFDALVKIRYNMPAVKASCSVLDNVINVSFYQPVNSVTPGQSGVLYDINDGHLLGGGIVT